VNGYKLALRLPEQVPQPTVIKMNLTKSLYDLLNSWLGNDRLLFIEEQTGAVCPGQLCSAGMDGTPEGCDTEYSLFVLLDHVPAGMPEKRILFRMDKEGHRTDGENQLTQPADGELTQPADRENQPPVGVSLDHQTENARTVVRINGRLFTRYLYSADLMKPYFYPLIGPARKTLVQDAPDDHLHHHGLWWGHDQVNGHRVYHEFAGEGRQVHREFLAAFGGTVMGQITSRIDWLTNGGERLLQEIRTMRIYNLPEHARYVDLSTRLFATEGDVAFGDTKEGGFPFIRVNEQINGYHTGTITSSTGRQGEKEIFGNQADWVDYSGKIYVSPAAGHVEAGISMFVHPEYREFSSRWFVRDYGPFTCSNFHFYGGHTLPANRSIAFRQRIYIHAGNAITGQVAGRYREYAHPVEPELVQEGG